MSLILPLITAVLGFRVGALAAEPDRYVTTVGASYSSIYVTDGFRVGSASPVLQLSLKLDIPRTDISLMYWNALRVNRGDKEFDEHDFFVLYSRAFNQDSKYALNFHASYDYWVFPNNSSRVDGFGDTITTGMFQGGKVNVGFAFPKLFPMENARLVPAYNIYYWLYWADNRTDQYRGGARHELSLNYTEFFPDVRSEMGSPYAGLYSSISYHDGAFGVRPGVSHTVVSAYVGTWISGSEFSVSANQQFSHQSTVNPRNDFWLSLSASRVF